MNNKRIPAQCFHPGEFIHDEMVARGWSASVLAKRMSRRDIYQESDVVQLIEGKQDINSKLAFSLSNALGISVDFWISAQRAFNDWKAVEQLRALDAAKTPHKPNCGDIDCYECNPPRQ